MTMLIQWAVTSSVLILAVVLVRTLLGKRMGAGLRYALWAVVLLRLLIPVQLFSVPMPRPVQEALEHHQVQTADPAPVYPPAGNGNPGTVVLTPATQVPGAVQEDMPPAFHDPPHTPATPAAPAPKPFDWQGALGWLWLAGGVAMGLALAVCNIRFAVDLRRRRRPVQTDCRLPVYAVEGLESPCLFGVVRPAVYVTPETAANPVMLRHVLAHETTHARHGDQVWSLLRCFALAVHWWNPLVWLAASLSRRDGELACDEGAIRLLGDGERKAYGWTLLTLITAQPSPVSLMNAATTMSGGKKALWERVRRIAHAQKRAVWAAALAVALAAAVTACAFASAAAPGEEPDPTASASPGPTQSEPPAASADPAVVQTAHQALYRAVSEKEDIRFSSGNQHYDYGVNTANVTNLWPALGQDMGEGVLTPDEFTVLDLDGDGVDEAVLRTGDTDGWVFVLHYENGGVRGYCYYIRWFNAWALKADGTAPNSSSAAESGVGRLSFAGVGTALIEDVLYELPVDGDWSNMRYTVNGQEVGEAEYNAAYDAWNAQPEAPWYDFTQENIDALLGGVGGVTSARINRKPAELIVTSGDSEWTFTLTYDGRTVRFQDVLDGNWGVDLAGVDLDRDGTEEIAVMYSRGHGTGLLAGAVRVFDAGTLEELGGEAIADTAVGMIRSTADGENYYLSAPGMVAAVPKAALEADGDVLLDALAFGDHISFCVEDGILYCDLAAEFGFTFYFGNIRVELGLENGGLVCNSFRYATSPDAYVPEYAYLAYQDVLNGLTGFMFMEDGEPERRTAADINALIDPYDSYVRIERYALVDMDGDGEDEIVLWGCGVSSDTGGYLILHRMAGQVYGFKLRRWDMSDLKADGTWEYADPTGVSELGVRWTTFTRAGMAVRTMASASSPDNGESWGGYTVGGKAASKADYDSFMARQRAKEDAVWNDFTQGVQPGGTGGGLAALRTDLNRNGVPETLEVVEIDGGKRLRVMENGYCVWSEDGFYAHGGWNTLFLWRFEDHDWLLRYNPNMTTGSANHSYSLFCLTDGWQQVRDGEVTRVEMVDSSGAMKFDTNFTQAWHQPMVVDAVAEFLGRLAGLLGDAQLLMNTNPELEDLHERTGRWLTYPWDQFSTGGFSYDRNKSLKDNLRAWEEAGEFPDRQSAIARAAYQDILNGRSAFIYSADWGMDIMGVAGIHALFDPYDPSMRIRKYALLDSDQDGVDEMVLYVCGASGDKGGYMVLDLEDGVNVDGYKVDWRETEDTVWQEAPYIAPAESGGLPFAGPFLLQFCSGAGGWSTDLTLNADGTFTGEYSDSDMGDSGPGYQGTEYICTFHGRFGGIKQVSEHVWSLTLAELVLDTGHPIGEEWIEGGTRYISSAPYGLSAAGADAPPEPGAAFMFYTPGATQRETGADEDFYWWLDMGPRMDFNCWALHNLDTNYGFLAL